MVMGKAHCKVSHTWKNYYGIPPEQSSHNVLGLFLSPTSSKLGQSQITILSNGLSSEMT